MVERCGRRGVVAQIGEGEIVCKGGDRRVVKQALIEVIENIQTLSEQYRNPKEHPDHRDHAESVVVERLVQDAPSQSAVVRS